MNLGFSKNIFILVFIFFEFCKAIVSDCNCRESVRYRKGCTAGSYLDESTCLSVGCCYDNTRYPFLFGRQPHCYVKKGNCPTLPQCIVGYDEREICGYGSLQKSYCVSRGCCFDDRQYPNCYKPKQAIIETAPAVKYNNGISGPGKIYYFGSMKFHIECQESGKRCSRPASNFADCVSQHCCWNPTNVNTNMSACYKPAVTMTKEDLNGGKISNWGPWGGYSKCIGTPCTKSVQARYRSCFVNGDLTQASVCTGSGFERRECYMPCNTAMWSVWSNCVASKCGIEGIQSRKRICPRNKLALLNILTCGFRKPLQYRKCMNPCTVDIGTSVWSQWGLWSECNGQGCISGSRNKTRTCISTLQSHFCIGDDVITENCTSACTTKWSAWQTWSQCSDKCGSNGIAIRKRICIDSDNKTAETSKCGSQAGNEKRNCNEEFCDEWSKWGCPTQCKHGNQTRHRFCIKGGTTLAPDYCYISVSPCNNHTCIQNGASEWSSWGQWSPCSNQCGTGVQNRNRTCVGGTTSHLPPQNIKDGCQDVGNISTESKPCNTLMCSVWSLWGDTSLCSATCGNGTKTRKRVCLFGALQLTPNDCESDVIQCFVKSCKRR